MAPKPGEPATGKVAGSDAEGPGKAAGVGSLIRGNRGNAGAQDSATMAPASAKPRVVPASEGIPRWYLFGGDLLLVALAMVVAYAGPHPMGWKQMLFCGAVVVLGACLAVFAMRGSPPGRGQSSNRR